MDAQIVNDPYNSTIKVNELLRPATTWIILKGIMLSGRNQSQKITHHLHDILLKRENETEEGRLALSRVGGGGKL